MARLVLRDTLAVHFDGSALERAVRRVEGQRRAVRWALGLAIVAVLVLELRLPETLVRGRAMVVELVPVVSIRVFGYLVAAWLLTQPSRYRFGFGLALGLGLVQATLRLYALATGAAVEGPASAAALAVVHAALVVLAFRASLAYPSQSRRWPWVAGAASALVFVVLLPMAVLSIWRSVAGAPASAAAFVPVIPLEARAAAGRMAACARAQRTGEVRSFPDADGFTAACRAESGQVAVAAEGGARATLQQWSASYDPLPAPDGTVPAFRIVVDVVQGQATARAIADTSGELAEVILPSASQSAAGRTPESR